MTSQLGSYAAVWTDTLVLCAKRVLRNLLLVHVISLRKHTPVLDIMKVYYLKLHT